MTDTIKSDKSKFNVKSALGYLGWVIIYSIILLGLGFYYGSKSQAKAAADTNAAVQAAVHSLPTSK